MAVIEVQQVTREYGERGGGVVSALRGVSVLFEQGSFACIAGPSGSGKTTLLNIIGALDKPTAGRVIIDGRDLTPIPLHALAAFRLRHIGFVFQSYNLITTLTALENVEYVLMLQGRPRADRRAQARAALEAVGLAGYAHRRVTLLSGGQQQRVAVARAMAAEPAVILADEPTANLDAAAALDLLALMRRLNQEQGATFIFSSHDQKVIDCADRVLIMEDGRLSSCAIS